MLKSLSSNQLQKPLILTKSEGTEKDSSRITAAADSGKRALGFMPPVQYSQAIEKGKIWVAADKDSNNIGHIFFGGRPPEFLRVFQVHVHKENRKRGVAPRLVK